MSTEAVWLPDGASILTLLQREILWLVASGYTNAQIAERLGMTPGRVGTHVGRIVARLGFDRRAEIAPWVSWHIPRRERPDELPLSPDPSERPQTERGRDSRTRHDHSTG
jgi:DNA-binding CsgD family transcriptional regulator